MTKPLIGISLDCEEPGGYSLSPWYALRQNYCTCVSDHGAAALPLPHDMAAVETYARLLDGLVITGGGFDVPPSYYGQTHIHEAVKLKEGRSEFEYELAKKMLALDKPILGICGGQQLLTVLLGGTLYQHIPDEVPGAISHKQQPPYNKPAHAVSIIEGTLLHKIVGRKEMNVNTDHHQATRDISDQLIVNAIAPDGVIEGVESPSHRFCLGVVWHPEHVADPADRDIVKAFVRAAGEHKS